MTVKRAMTRATRGITAQVETGPLQRAATRARRAEGIVENNFEDVPELHCVEDYSARHDEPGIS